jgi:RNA polymerase sigma-70 factor (ECF subfamily)
MSANASFDDLLRRVRAGDHEAAEELVRTYEPEIRDAVRRRLQQADLGRILDSMDISQSVLNSFFVRTAAGQYELHQPEDLIKLLVRMARNKVIDQARKHHREITQTPPGATDSQVERAVVADTTPSQQLARGELFLEVQRRLSPEERRLAELRLQGQDWARIAAAMGGTAQARRKQLARALDRVAQELGLDEIPRG